MTQMHITLRTAPAAIAAVLALSGLPAHAQDAAPTIVLPDVSTVSEAPAPQPVSSPVVQAVPVTPEPAEAAPVVAQAPAAERPRVSTRTIAAPVPVTVVPAPPVESVNDPAPPPAPMEAVDAIQPEAIVPVDAGTIETDNDGAIAPLLGGAAAIGLGLMGLAAFRRRKTRVAAEAVPVIVKPRLADPAPLADPAIAAVTEVPHATVSDIRPARFEQPQGALPNRGAAVALPQVAPTDYEERTALLRRMVEARPDRANPFVHRKARMRRARLILQSLGYDFADRDPLIDLSDYPQNWPLVARRKYATAA